MPLGTASECSEWWQGQRR